LALIPLDEVVHVEKSLREIASQMSDGGGQGTSNPRGNTLLRFINTV